MSGCQPFCGWQSRFPLFMHADRKALVLYEEHPSNSKAKLGRLILVLCHLSRTVPLITYLQCIPVFVLHAIYICACRRGCCR